MRHPLHVNEVLNSSRKCSKLRAPMLGTPREEVLTLRAELAHAHGKRERGFS